MFRQVMGFLLTFSLVTSAFAEAAGSPSSLPPAPVEAAKPVAKDVLQEDTFAVEDSVNGSTIAIQRRENASPEDVEKLLSDLPAERSFQILVSTDSPRVLEKTVTWAQSQPAEKQPHLLPFGKLVSKEGLKRFGKKISGAGHAVVQAVRSDPIGMMITVVTTSMDSYIWIHSQDVELNQRIAMVMTNVVLAASFGLNKDLWSKMARPIQSRMLDVLKRFPFVSGSERKSEIAEMVTCFAANVSLSVALQMTRMTVLSWDHLARTFSDPHMWATTVGLGALLTFSSIGWSEHLARMSESRNPVAKFAFRRWMEMRVLALSYVAPSSKLLQPTVYGYGPLLALLVHGTAGIVAAIMGPRLNRWVEHQGTLQWAQRATTDLARKFQEGIALWWSIQPSTCAQVFAL